MCQKEKGQKDKQRWDPARYNDHSGDTLPSLSSCPETVILEMGIGSRMYTSSVRIVIRKQLPLTFDHSGPVWS
jgi:hypothetical protein